MSNDEIKEQLYSAWFAGWTAAISASSRISSDVWNQYYYFETFEKQLKDKAKEYTGDPNYYPGDQDGEGWIKG